MGPLAEHYRSTEALAALREAELARTFSRRQSLGIARTHGDDVPPVLRLIARRLLHRPRPRSTFPAVQEALPEGIPGTKA